MTVVDTSALVDFLLGVGVADEVRALMSAEGELAAPDLVIFETLAVLRRETLRGVVADERAASAIEDLGDVPVEMFPSMPLRRRAWSLKANMTAADALFVALAEQLGEPLATKDEALVAEAARHADVSVVSLSRSS